METAKRDLKLFMEEQIRSKDVRIVESTVPFSENVVIHDLSINQRGTDEDKAYAFNEQLRYDIRRGNSVACKINEEGAPPQYFWVRKGLQKFFDLQREYIEYNLSNLAELTKFGIKNGAEHKELYRIIFDGVTKAIEAHDSVSIYKLVKANGENAQVSYFPELDAWVISSKNVALMARDEKDLLLYAESKDRFGFARLIANAWFKSLDNIVKTQGEEAVAALKKELTGHTMVGEYCGNQEYQHLVKYDDITILFYAIVDHEANESCIPPEKSYDLFKRYNFNSVTMTNEGTYGNFKAFNERLRDVFDSVASSDIEGEQEGSVLYFVQGIPGGKQRVISLSKLKTLEYRIFRKLREKLKNYNLRKDEKIIRKYEEETKELCLNNAPAHPLEFYFGIGKLAFTFVKDFPEQASIVSDQYISFLSMLMHCQEHNETPSPAHLEKGRLETYLAQPWSSYKSFQEKNDGKPLNIVPVNSVEKGPALLERNLTVFIPISIPGMGKSTLVNNLIEISKEKHGGEVEILQISSDEVRRGLMENLRRQKPHLKDQQLYEQTQKNASKEFFAQLNTLLSLRAQNSKAKHVIVFIDKNHPPNSIDNTVASIRSGASKAFNLKICAIIPSGTKQDNYVIGTSVGYPFTLNFMLDCIQRVQTRKFHPTLPGNGKQSLDVMVMFINLFRGCSLSRPSLFSSGVDDVVEFPFIKEEPSRKFPADLISKFDEVMASTTPGQVCKIPNIVQSLSDKLKSAALEFSYPSKEDCYNHSLQAIQKAFNSVETFGVTSKMESKIEEEEEQKQEQPTKLKRKAPVRFNPAQKPIYLGIFANDPDFAKKEQKTYVQRNLDILYERLGDEILKYSSQNLLKVFKYPVSHHITTYFVKRQEGQFYENFEEGLNIPIESLAIAFVPNQIICGVCLPDPQLIDIENPVPHITLFVGDLAPRFSNNVLQSLFVNQATHEAPLKKLLESNKLSDPNKEIIEKFNLPIAELPGTHDIYFIKPKNNIMTLPATTRAFFKNSKFHQK